MTTVNVWRLEHPRDGLGPFSSHSSDDRWWRRHEDFAQVESTLGWYECGIMSRIWDATGSPKTIDMCRAGCATLDDLLDYFAPAWPHLAVAGFEVVEYRVPEQQVFRSLRDMQVAFLPAGAEILRRQPAVAFNPRRSNE